MLRSGRPTVAGVLQRKPTVKYSGRERINPVRYATRRKGMKIPACVMIVREVLPVMLPKQDCRDSSATHEDHHATCPSTSCGNMRKFWRGKRRKRKRRDRIKYAETKALEKSSDYF